MKLLNIFLIIILCFYAFSIIVRLIFKRRIKRLQRQMEDYVQNEAPSAHDDAKSPHVDPNIGEYTDFEEVE